MKRLVALLLILLLVCPAALGEGVSAQVIGGWLRLRDAPSYDSNTLASYYTGTAVTILSTSNGWSYVRMSDGTTGYMNASYLSATPSSGWSGSSGTSGTSIYVTGYVTSSNGGRVALRSGAGKSYAVITYCNVGTTLTVLNAGSTWNRVQVGSTIGYMMAKYITYSPVTPVTPTQAPSSGTVAYVTSANGKGVNLRQGAGTTYPVLASYPVGTQVAILQTGTTWCYISVSGMTGYMMRQYLTTTKPGSQPVPTISPTGQTAYVTSANGKAVRLRSGPGTGYGVIGLYNVNTLVTVLEGGSTWSRIRVGNQVGYMMSMYLSYQGGSPSPSTVYTAYVTSENGKGVYLRSGPSTSDAAIALYPVGTQVKVLKGNGTWDYVSIGTRTGYMMHKFLTTSYVSNEITAVTISNLTPKVGDTLAAITVPNSASGSFTWVNDLGVVLSNASYYVTTGSDIGRKIRVRAVGAGSYTGSATSGFTEAVTSAVSLNKVTDCTLNQLSPRVGDVLKASAVPSNATASFIWYREGQIAVGTGSTYTVTNYDIGSYLYAVAIGYDTWTDSATSVTTDPVQAKAEIALSGSVSLPSSAVVGTIITPSLSLNSYAISYAWYQNGVLVGTGATLTATADMAGDDIRLVVTAITGSGYTGSVSSQYCLIQSSVNGGNPPPELIAYISPVPVPTQPVPAEWISPVSTVVPEQPAPDPNPAFDGPGPGSKTPIVEPVVLTGSLPSMADSKSGEFLPDGHAQPQSGFQRSDPPQPAMSDVSQASFAENAPIPFETLLPSDAQSIQASPAQPDHMVPEETAPIAQPGQPDLPAGTMRETDASIPAEPASEIETPYESS